MPKYRNHLPQMSEDVFLADGGLETTLIFHEGVELPEFAAFVLLKDQAGRQHLLDYYRRYASIARDAKVGLVLDSATWRANPDWGLKIGYSSEALAEANRCSIELCRRVRDESETETTKMPISGCLGPRGDGYRADTMMLPDEAQEYHGGQIETFRATGADFVSAITMTYVNEAIGVTRAAQAAGMPAVVSFTVETDGRLPDGSTLAQAIDSVDEASDQGPEYYMINCAHPTHFQDALKAGAGWTDRIRGVRVNASTCSHAELDEAEELDEGNPVELGSQLRALRDAFPQITVLGGCCGTDHRHVEEIGRACVVN